jgi:hypothetical protein
MERRRPAAVGAEHTKGAEGGARPHGSGTPPFQEGAFHAYGIDEKTVIGRAVLPANSASSRR